MNIMFIPTKPKIVANYRKGAKYSKYCKKTKNLRTGDIFMK